MTGESGLYELTGPGLTVRYRQDDGKLDLTGDDHLLTNDDLDAETTVDPVIGVRVTATLIDGGALLERGARSRPHAEDAESAPHGLDLGPLLPRLPNGCSRPTSASSSCTTSTSPTSSVCVRGETGARSPETGLC